jgi:Pyruvate/2-oxoacid:ferredoxin oxidoreductase delta subunit
MEGNGPNNGTPRQIGIIGASTDAVALDSVLCRLLGFNIEHVRTCVIARNMGIGATEADQIEQTGDRLDGFPLRDFKAPKSATMAWNMSPNNPLRKFLESYLITRPDIDTGSCRNCGVCVEHCPPRAIREVDGLMTIDRTKCISCFCCHELCTNKAIQIVQPFFGRFMSRISR